MKKIILLAALIISSLVLFFLNKENNTISEELSDFAVEDTSRIQKVFFADKHGNTVTLSKKEKNIWLVNNEFIARSEAVDFLLKTIKDIEVKHPVSNSMHDRIIKNLASSAVKVEIFTENPDESHKTYFIGGEAKDLIGSFMLLENSSRAFVVYIPGFNGFLSPRYTIDGTTVGSDLWRDRNIFRYNPKDIKTVSVTNHDDSTQSFKMHRQKEYYSFTKNKITKVIPESQGDTYMDLFKSVNSEGFMNDYSKKDSIFKSKPFYTISITDQNGKTDSLVAYHKEPKREEYMQDNGEKLEYDVDRMYAKINSDLILIQFYVFDKILLRSPQFSVEK
jgi:hypothetical protein